MSMLPIISVPPIIIIFERHWDEIPKLVIKDLLPNLEGLGYDTLCLEGSQNMKASEMIERCNSKFKRDIDLQNQAENSLKKKNIIIKKLSDESFNSLALLMKEHVSSKRYLEVAEKIKNLPALKLFKDILDQADKLSLSIKTIDIDDYDEMFSYGYAKKEILIELYDDRRINTIFNNLLKLRKEQKGIVFNCGAFHANKLLNKFAEKGMQDDVLYYFPHSSKYCDDDIDQVKELKELNGTLQDHTYLLSKDQIKPFIANEIVSKITYKEEVLDGNSHTLFLSKFFKAKFRAFLRPGYYVDALVDINETVNIEDIKQKIHTIGVQTHNVSFKKRKYLVILAVNTPKVAEKIHKLYSLIK